MEEIGIGVLRLSPEEYRFAPLRTIINGMRGAQRVEQENQKTIWEAERFSASCILNAWSKNKVKPTDLVRFPWEKNKKREPLSYEQFVKDLDQISG